MTTPREDAIAVQAEFDHKPTYYAGSNTPTCCIGHALAMTPDGPQPYRGLHRHDPLECASCARLIAEASPALDAKRLTEAIIDSPEWQGAAGAMANITDFVQHGKASLTDENVADLKALLALDLSLIGKAFGVAIAALAAEADRGTFVQGIRDPKATARSIADAALDAAREAAESRPDPKHGPHGNEGYCYCGVFVGHDGDWSSHRADPTPEPDR